MVREENALVNPLISIVRIDAPLCFLNVSFVSKFFKQIFSDSPPKVIVMDWSSVCYIDISGYKVLKKAIEESKNNEIIFLHAQLKGSVSEDLRKFGLLSFVDTDHIFFELHDAVLCASSIIRKRERENENKVFVDDFLLLDIDDLPSQDYSPLIYHNQNSLEEKKCVIF